MRTSFNLRTKRLRLRLVTEADADLLWPYTSDPETGKYMSWDAHTTRGETADLLRRLAANAENGAGYTWAIFRRGVFCGIISIISILRAHRSLRYDRGELAYWLGKPFRGQGIMTEAGGAVVEFAFQKLNLRKLVVGHVAQNKASQALVRKLGFRYIGCLRQEFSKNGELLDVKSYELLRPAALPQGKRPL